MKTLYKIFIALFLISTTLASCKKFLDTEPQDFFTNENFYTDSIQLNTALVSIYSVLQETPLYGGRIIRNGFDVDDGFVGITVNKYDAAYYDVPTTEPNIASFWEACYKGIDKANSLLENINKPVISEGNRNAIKGEALFLRGYFYFLLVRNFGAVPLKLESTKSGLQTALARTPAKALYQQIIKDMEESEPLVLSINIVGHGGRINKSAVRGILSRVNLHMAGYPVNDESRYAEAKKWAKMVLDDETHMLNADFSAVFKNYAADRYDIKESLWEIEFWGNTQGLWREAGQIGVYNGIAYPSATIDVRYGYSYGIIFSTGVLWDKYDEPTSLYSRDIRRNFTIAPYIFNGNPAVEKYWTINQIYNRNCGKYRREYEVVTPKERIYSPMNFPILRYSDVLLMYAEAENYMNGPILEAVEKVNLVRRRGYGKYLNGIGSTSESIASIRVDNQGSGYTAGTTVTISGGGGEVATATATIAGGKVTGIRVVNPGAKFTMSPIVNITGVGTGAKATAILTSPGSADLKPEAYSSKEAFLKTIQDERSRELCFEALRKGDLIRWGIFLESMKAVEQDVLVRKPSNVNSAIVSYKNATSRDVVWPIPAYEMGLNSALVQNQGW